jgi:hypothetical protein
MVGWQIVVALLVAVPVILLPLVIVWYLNLDNIIPDLAVIRRNKTFRRHQLSPDVEIF